MSDDMERHFPTKAENHSKRFSSMPHRLRQHWISSKNLFFRPKAPSKTCIAIKTDSEVLEYCRRASKESFHTLSWLLSNKGTFETGLLLRIYLFSYTIPSTLLDKSGLPPPPNFGTIQLNRVMEAITRGKW